MVSIIQISVSLISSRSNLSFTVIVRLPEIIFYSLDTIGGVQTKHQREELFREIVFKYGKNVLPNLSVLHDLSTLIFKAKDRSTTAAMSTLPGTRNRRSTSNM